MLNRNQKDAAVIKFPRIIIGLAAIAISQIMGYIRIFDGVIDPAIGIIIDKTDTKFGKYRPSIPVAK